MSTPQEKNPQDRVQQDVKDAMKSGDKSRLATLRMLLNEIKNERIRAGDDVDEERFVALVRKGIKQRQDAASQFRDGGREERAAQEETEAEVLEVYLPAQVGEDELRAAVEGYVAEAGLSGMQAMGAVMKEMMSRFGASADGRTLSGIVRDVLSSD